MVCIETELARRAYRHEIPTNVLKNLTRVGARIMAAYLALKLFDIIAQGQVGLLFAGNMQSNMFLLELFLGIIIPLGIIFSPYAKTRNGLLTYSLLVAGGVVLNRMNMVFTSMYTSGSYFPSIWEFIVSAGLISVGCLLYCFIVENFVVIGESYAVPAKVQDATGAHSVH